jgi:hypothetical protein
VVDLADVDWNISQAILQADTAARQAKDNGRHRIQIVDAAQLSAVQRRRQVAKELEDASVPFPFDVHAMIRTSDAPSLENALHKHFDRRRLNLENERKEFFRVSIDEIRQELGQLRSDLGACRTLR